MNHATMPAATNTATLDRLSPASAAPSMEAMMEPVLDMQHIVTDDLVLVASILVARLGIDAGGSFMAIEAIETEEGVESRDIEWP